MRILIIGCAAILLVSLPAWAQRTYGYHRNSGNETRPYVGLNLQFNSPTGDFGNEDIGVLGNGAAQTGTGVELDVGMASPQFSAYAGVRGVKFDTDTHDPNYDAEWTANRFVLGMRGHLFSDRDTNILPTLGGGVTVGQTRLEETFLHPDGGVEVIKQHSETSIGWFLEGGMLAYLSPQVALNANLQYHNYGAHFDPYPLGSGNFTISHLTLQIGVNVFFSELYHR